MIAIRTNKNGLGLEAVPVHMIGEDDNILDVIDATNNLCAIVRYADKVGYKSEYHGFYKLLDIAANAPRKRLLPADYIPCKYCGQKACDDATKLCDSCRELESRIMAFPKLAERILANLKGE